MSELDDGARSPSSILSSVNRATAKTRKQTIANASLTNADLGNGSMHSGLSHSLSSPMYAIAHKKDLLSATRRVNPSLTNSAPAAFWDPEAALKSSNIDRSGAMQQLVIVENGVNSTAKRLNDLKINNERLTITLKSKLDKLELTKKDFEMLDAMSKAATEEAARIEQLKADCVIVSEAIATKTHYTRRLDFLLTRLHSNQIRFEAHLNGMENAVAGIEKEYREVRLLRRALDVGLSKAQAVYDETVANLSMARKERDLLLTQRKHEHRNAAMLEQRMKERVEARTQLLAELRGGLDEEEERYRLQHLHSQEVNARNVKSSLDKARRELAALEHSFVQLSQVTGVADYEQMTEKFTLIAVNRSGLERDKQAAEDRLIGAKKQALALEKQFQELRSEGVGVAEITRESMDGCEDSLLNARGECKMQATRAERLEAVIVGLQQAGLSLKQRVDSYATIIDEDVFKSVQTDEEQPWTLTLDTLNIAEQVLVKMVETLSMGDGSPTRGKHAGFVDEEGSEGSESSGSEESLPLHSSSASRGANNVRIYSRRERVRDEAEGGGRAGRDDEKQGRVEVAVPGRVEVKRKAAVTTVQAVKRKELDEKNKSMSSKLGGGQADTGEARLRAQLAYADKLSSADTHTLSLPPRGTLRDDVMTKSLRFLEATVEEVLN